MRKGNIKGRTMTAEVISYMMADREGTERMRFEIVSQCAPFLKGMKAASLLNIGRENVRELFGMMEGTGVSFRILPARRERWLALFYRKEELEKALSQREAWGLLSEYGYAEKDAERILARLFMRMFWYSRGEIAFPHEIGVILGYPVRDVRTFISRNGQGSLFTGYWKVYHNPVQAGIAFFAYDKAKDSAVNEFLSGKTIQEIARTGRMKT